MSGLFPGGASGRREDPELTAAAKRQRESFAADIGDEHARAWAHDPPKQRPRRVGRLSVAIVGVFLAFAVLGAIPLLTGGDGALLRPDCQVAGVAVGTGHVPAGKPLGVQAAGPELDGYVVALDAAAVPGGQVVVPEFRMNGCRSAQVVITAPTSKGEHAVTLFHRVDGAFKPLATATFDVE